MPKVRTPTAIKLLEGRQGQKTPPNSNEPVFEGEYETPPQLNGRALEIYKRFHGILDKAGVLKVTDTYILAAWAQIAHTLERTHATRVQDRTLTQFRQLSAELGLSPASRAKLKIIPQHGEKEIDRFFKPRLNVVP